jgi:hypothetical protein
MVSSSAPQGADGLEIESPVDRLLALDEHECYGCGRNIGWGENCQGERREQGYRPRGAPTIQSATENTKSAGERAPGHGGGHSGHGTDAGAAADLDPRLCVSACTAGAL